MGLEAPTDWERRGGGSPATNQTDKKMSLVRSLFGTKSLIAAVLPFKPYKYKLDIPPTNSSYIPTCSLTRNKPVLVVYTKVATCDCRIFDDWWIGWKFKKKQKKNKGHHARTRGMIRAAREIGSSIPAGSPATFHLIVLQSFQKNGQIQCNISRMKW